jgi:hypothetical protein
VRDALSRGAERSVEKLSDEHPIRVASATDGSMIRSRIPKCSLDALVRDRCALLIGTNTPAVSSVGGHY